MNYPSLSLEQKQIENAFASGKHQKPSQKQQTRYFQGSNKIPLKSNVCLNQITKCDQCDYKTSKYDLMYSHMRVKHSDSKIKCTECNFSHPFPTKVNTHYKQVHLGVRRHHRRYICRKRTCHKFDTKNCPELESHSLLFCEKCKFSSARSDDFKFHTESVHDGIVYKCDYCSYTAKRKGNLNEHILHKHSIRNEKEFKTIFTCTDEECKFETQYRSTLKSHIESKHEGIVRYKCDFMNCDYRTNESKSLKEHSFLHSGAFPHKCDICHKMFTRVRQMKKHKKEQHIGTGEEIRITPLSEKHHEDEIKSNIDLMKPEINIIEFEKNEESYNEQHHVNERAEKAAEAGEKEKHSSDETCLCARPGCDFMSEENEMREHFSSAHSDMPFANDSFIWLNSDMAMLLGKVV